MKQTARIVRPTIGRNVFIADTSYVGGEVTLGDDCTVMNNVTIRGDVSAIVIGNQVNVQDGSVVHTKNGVPLEIGDRVAIGHNAVVHCRRIGPGTLIGSGSITLDDCEIGAGCIVAAGAVLPPGTKIPDGKLVVGIPGRVLRDVSEDDHKYIGFVIENYMKLGQRHAAGRYPNWNE